MDELEDVAILTVFQFLSLPDRLKLAQVSRRLNSIASTKLLWRNVALTFTEAELLMSVDSRCPQYPVSNINVYSEYFGQYAHSLDLTINIPFGYNEPALVQVEQIVNALKLINLQTLMLRFPDFCNMFKFEAFFNAIKWTLTKFGIICRFPHASLHLVEELCKMKPLMLRELVWMHGPPNLITPPTAWLASLMLEGIEQTSQKVCPTQRDVDELCDSIKLCENLLLFRTNLLTNSLLEAFSKVTKQRAFSIVWVADETSILDVLCGKEYSNSLEDCKDLDLVLQVTSSEPCVISVLKRFPTALPVRKILLKLADCQNLFGVSQLLRVAMGKFPDSLKTIDVDINGRKGAMMAQAVKWIKETYPNLLVSP